MVIKEHRCHLDLGSDSFLPRDGGLWTKASRGFSKLAQVSPHHPRTFEHFHSYPAVMAERQRHLYEGGRYLIHPFSIFSLSWRSLMMVVNLAHMILSTFRLFYILDPIYLKSVHPLDTAVLALELVCWADIALTFNTGFVEKDQEGPNIVLDRERIACSYVRSWLMCDLLSALPLSYLFLVWRVPPHYTLVTQALTLLRCARICTVTTDLTYFVKMFTRSYVWHGGVRHAVLFWLTAHWCSCLIYLPSVYPLYWHGKLLKEHHTFLGTKTNITDVPITKRYSKSIFIALSGFFGTGYSMFLVSEPDELLLHSLIILYSAMFMVYNFVFLLKVYMMIYFPTVRYHELMNEVKEYMRLKQFPAPLKKRVRAFYYYRYRELYYSEHTVLGSLSEELRNEITLHTCYKLVNKVALFKGVPASVIGSVLGSLHPEVYLPNDSVLSAGDIGECMYFVAHGTLAVYSLKGVEVCHLEDGAHFGEVALLMKDSKRVATVVAVEMTQLYRLDVNDFKKFVVSNELLYERIAALASKRMHETVLLDEDFRRERERLQEKQQSFTTSQVE